MDELPSSPLPADLLLEILARCDPATVIRCAATCKLWYRSITAPAFPGLLRARTGRRPVTRLVGWFDRRGGFTETRTSSSSCSCDATAAMPPVAETIRSFMSRHAELLEPFELVASRGGLVLFRRDAAYTYPLGGARRRGRCSRLCCLWICNPVTGWRRSIPAPAVHDQAHVLLVGEDGRSFRLVAVDLTTLPSYGEVSFQTFTASSPDGRGGAWGPVTELSPPEDFDGVVDPTPVVLGGRVAHWLFRTCGAYNVLALDVSAKRAACIGLPPESALGSGAIPRKQMLLSSTADGRVSLIAVEETRISVWAHTAAAGGGGGGGDSSGCWSLHAAYEREWIARFVAPQTARRKPGYPVMDLLWSGGTLMLMSVHGVQAGYFLLNMETNEIVWTKAGICPYELDLALLTAHMKSF